MMDYFNDGLLPLLPHIYLHRVAVYLPAYFIFLHAGTRLSCMFQLTGVHVHPRMLVRRQKMFRHVISDYLGTVWCHDFMSHVIQGILERWLGAFLGIDGIGHHSMSCNTRLKNRGGMWHVVLCFASSKPSWRFVWAPWLDQAAGQHSPVLILEIFPMQHWHKISIQDIQADHLLFFSQFCLPTSNIDKGSLHKVSTLFLLLCSLCFNNQLPGEAFDMVRDFPESAPALLDLRRVQ
jgi:hypothetical protein